MLPINSGDKNGRSSIVQFNNEKGIANFAVFCQYEYLLFFDETNKDIRSLYIIKQLLPVLQKVDRFVEKASYFLLVSKTI